MQLNFSKTKDKYPLINNKLLESKKKTFYYYFTKYYPNLYQGLGFEIDSFKEPNALYFNNKTKKFILKKINEIILFMMLDQ